MKTTHRLHTHTRAFYITRISGPAEPLILALAEGWLASLTNGFASLNPDGWLRPLSLLIDYTNEQLRERGD